MRGVLLLARNDVLLTVRDRPALAWLLILPLVMMYFFGQMIGDGAAPLHPTATVSNQDGGELGALVLEQLEVQGLRILPVDTPDAPRRVVIPPGFTESVLAGRPENVILEVRVGSDPQESLALQILAVRAVVRLLAALVEGELEGLPADADFLRARLRAFDAQRLVVLKAREGGRLPAVPSGFQQSVPGMLTMTVLMMTLIYGSAFMSLERRTGMFLRQASLPLSRGEIFAGKLLGRLAIAWVQLILLVPLGGWIFGVSWGSAPGALLLLLGSYSLAVASLTTLFGGWVKGPEQASTIGWLVSMVLSGLGGCWWPLQVMPSWLQAAAHALPTTWAMKGLHALVSAGGGIEDVWGPSLALLLFASAFAAAGSRSFRFQ